MTDLARLKAFLDGAKVEYTEDVYPDSKGTTSTIVECREGDTKVKGYCSFFTSFEFTPKGELIDMGAYE